MELTPVRIEFIVRAQEAIAELHRVNAEMDKIAVKGKMAGSSIASMEKSSKLAGTALLGLGSLFGFVAYEGIKSAMDLQTSQSRLQTAVQNSGVSFAAAKPIIDKHAEAMANLGFTTADTYEALGTMTTATRSPQMALNALSVAADLARYKHISLAQASTLVSRAALGQVKGLADLGGALNKSIPKGASFAQILQFIETRTHGVATAFSQTSAGQLQVLQAKFKSLEEQLGIGLLPAFNNILKWLTGPGLSAMKSFGKIVNDNKVAVEALVGVLALIWVAPKIDAMLAILKKLVLGWGGVTTAAEEAATAEEVAAGAGKTGPLVTALRSPYTAMAAIAGTVAYDFYKAGTDQGPPQPPTIGGKAGAAQQAQYKKELAAYNAKQTNLSPEIMNQISNAGGSQAGMQTIGKGPGLGGIGTSLLPSTKKGAKTSIAAAKKGLSGGTTTGAITNKTILNFEHKPIAQANATATKHNAPMSGPRTTPRN
jgi:hypothetical protein